MCKCNTAAEREAAVIYFCNFLLSLAGLCLVTIGGVGYAQYGFLAELVERDVFAYFTASGVVVLLFCLLGCCSAHCLLKDVDHEDNKKHAMCGRLGLVVYALIMLIFIILELVGGVMWLGYAGQIEIEKTGNAVIDETNEMFQNFVDRRVNCTFNYCCQSFTDTTTGKPKQLSNLYLYNVVSKDGAVVGRKQGDKQVDDSRSGARAFMEGLNMVSKEIDDEWKTTSVGHDGQLNRTVFAQQYYAGFEDVVNFTETSKSAHEWAKSNLEAQSSDGTHPTEENIKAKLKEVLGELAICKPEDAATADLGNQCWLKWKARCPKPLPGIKEAAWDEICTFITVRETWEYPDTVAKPNTKDPKEREPLLNKRMCNAVANGKGDGVTNEDLGFKRAVIWKVQRSISIAVGIIVLAVLQVLTLVTVCCAIFHRAHAGGVVMDGEKGSSAETGNEGANVKQSDGDNADDINDEHL